MNTFEQIISLHLNNTISPSLKSKIKNIKFYPKCLEPNYPIRRGLVLAKWETIKNNIVSTNTNVQQPLSRIKKAFELNQFQTENIEDWEICPKCNQIFKIKNNLVTTGFYIDTHEGKVCLNCCSHKNIIKTSMNSGSLIRYIKLEDFLYKNTNITLNNIENNTILVYIYLTNKKIKNFIFKYEYSDGESIYYSIYLHESCYHQLKEINVNEIISHSQKYIQENGYDHIYNIRQRVNTYANI